MIFRSFSEKVYNKKDFSKLNFKLFLNLLLFCDNIQGSNQNFVSDVIAQVHYVDRNCFFKRLNAYKIYKIGKNRSPIWVLKISCVEKWLILYKKIIYKCAIL